jgi:hypothetical protein
MLGKLGGGSAPNFLSSHPDPKRRQRDVNALIQKETLLEVARRAGGPRLSSTENFGSNSDNNSDNGYYSPTGNNSNTYPSTNDTNYYPPAADTAPHRRIAKLIWAHRCACGRVLVAMSMSSWHLWEESQDGPASNGFHQ